MPISKDDTLQSACLTVMAEFTFTNSFNATLYFESFDNAIDFSSLKENEISERPITKILLECMQNNRIPWVETGNSVVVILEAISGKARFASFENDDFGPPELSIAYF